MEQVHNAESSDKRDRNSNARNQRGAKIPQEYKHHQNHETDRNDQRPLHILHRSANRRGSIEHVRYDHRRRNGSLQRRDRRPNALHRINNICARLPRDDQQHGRLTVHKSCRSDVLHRILDVRNIRKCDRGAVVISHHQKFVTVGFQQLVVIHDVGGRQIVRDLAFCQIRILAAQHRRDIVQSQSVAVQLRGIQFHAHRRQRTSAHAHLPDALYLRQLLLDDR